MSFDENVDEREMTSTAPSAHLVELERLLGRLRDAKGGQTHYDMWDHYGRGTATEEQVAAMEADVAACTKVYRESQAALEALVAKLRAESPLDVQSWADAHAAYLDGEIADHVARGDGENSSVDLARRDRAEWVKVREGGLAFVNELIGYAAEGRQRYRELFGFDP